MNIPDFPMESFRLDVESQVNLKDAVIKYRDHFTLDKLLAIVSYL